MDKRKPRISVAFVLGNKLKNSMASPSGCVDDVKHSEHDFFYYKKTDVSACCAQCKRQNFKAQITYLS